MLLGNLKPLPAEYAKFFDYTIRKEFKESDEKKLKEAAVRFKLESKEVMLCADCTPETFMLKELECIEKEIVRMEKPKGGCFRVNGINIH